MRERPTGIVKAARSKNTPAERIRSKIMSLRGEYVLIDQDLAELYEVETRILVRNVKRNPDRFPPDFMFQLTNTEYEELKSHMGVSTSWGGRRYPPYAFTEHGVAMLSSVLNSERAIQVNIAIMRAFVKLREMLSAHKDLARKLKQMEKKYDEQFRVVFEAIYKLMEPSESKTRRKIGFKREKES